ncbi:hypothetical protein B0H19DRAFT_1061664 [Mycena capillaripes]|nr:hypothetical protein B0H19DRAFT_1061664 [Mycena capillaripes]
MRFLAPLLCVFVATPSVLAIEPQQITDTLNNLGSRANAMSPNFEKLSVQSTSQDVLDSIAAFEKYTEDYTQFSKDVVWGTAEDQTWDPSIAKDLSLAATEQSLDQAYLRLQSSGVSKLHMPQRGCEDGVKIGLEAALFTALGTKFPSILLAVGLDGLLIVAELPLQKLGVAECFAPDVPPVLPRGI